MKFYLKIFLVFLGLFVLNIDPTYAQVPPVPGTSLNETLTSVVKFESINNFVGFSIQPIVTCNVGVYHGGQNLKWNGSSWSFYGGGFSQTCGASGNVSNSSATSTTFSINFNQGSGYYAYFYKIANIPVASYSATNTKWFIVYYDGVSTSTGITIPNFLNETETLSSGLFNTKFLGVSGIEYSSSTKEFNFDVSQFIDLSEIDEGKPTRNITTHRVNYSTPTSSQRVQSFYFDVVSGNSTTSLEVYDNDFGSDGTYTFQITFGNIGSAFSGIIPFEETYIYFDVALEDGEIINIQIDSVYLPSAIIESQPCGLTNLSGCLINGMSYLFVPSSESYLQFLSLNDQLSVKFPFVYAYQFSDLIGDLYTASSSGTSTISYDFAGLGTLTLLSPDLIEDVPFQPWLREIIGYLMWIMFAVLMYNRTLRIFNTNPQ